MVPSSYRYLLEKTLVRVSLRPNTIIRSSSNSTTDTTTTTINPTPSTKDESTHSMINVKEEGKKTQISLLADGIAKEIAIEHKLSFAKSKRIVNSVFAYISESVSEGKNVKVKSFGTFTPILRSERTVNAFGKPTIIPARTAIKFKPSKALRETMSKK